MHKESFYIREMDCAEECTLLQKALRGKKGIVDLNFDILQRKLQVTYDPKLIDSQTILSEIKATGLSGSLWQKQEQITRSFWAKRGRLILCTFSGLWLLLGFLFHVMSPYSFFHLDFTPRLHFPPFLPSLFYFLSILTGGYYIVPKAYYSLKHFSFDMNLLMVIAVMGAILIGQVFEAATVVFLFSVATLLEHWSMDRARDAIARLLDLTPTLARVMEDGQLIEKNVENIAIGQTIFIRPGEKIPLDGEVITGSSSVNQAPITGESMPVNKTVGDLVFAGTMNEEGSLEVKVQKEANDTTLARIIQMVEKASEKKAKTQKWVDRFSRFYTPLMLIFAIFIALLPPLFFSASWIAWIYRGLVLLIIACPCALVLSTPVSIVSALTAAARFGVLIKGGIFLEVLGKLNAIAFDKTGTITYGKPSVQRIVPLNEHSEEELLQIAASLELLSNHPLAFAIVDKTKEKGISFSSASSLKNFDGLGAEGTVDGKKYWIGSHRFMHETDRKESKEAHDVAVQMEDSGHSVVAIGDFTHICGLLSIADQPRPYLAQTMIACKELGVKHLVMLTGDNQKTAEILAKEIGMDKCKAELLPGEKLQEVELLKQTYQNVAMVGDGVNDAPALAASSLGIAMGGLGTDIAFETADVVLMSDDLSQLPRLIRHGKKTLKVIQQNIGFALGVKGIFFILALIGKATLWMAIAADTGASLVVIMNALRLLQRIEPWKYTET